MLLLVELNGSGAGATADGLTLQGGDTTVQGLVINRFGGAGIRILVGGNLLQGNFIGTNFMGTAALGNGRGVLVVATASNKIGGAGAGEGNLLSGNAGAGVDITGAASFDNVIEGNLIGTDVTGIAALGNIGDGVRIDLGALKNRIGGTELGDGNTIAFNGGAGVLIAPESGTKNAILSNAIHDNARLGIDLLGGVEDANGVTGNDPGDTDTGPNALQNHPVLTSAQPTDDGTSVDGILSAQASEVFTIEFFDNTLCDPSEYGEGQKLLAAATVMTDGDGEALLHAMLISIPIGEFITATATDSTGNTSEFSACIPVGFLTPTPTSTSTPAATHTATATASHSTTPTSTRTATATSAPASPTRTATHTPTLSATANPTLASTATPSASVGVTTAASLTPTAAPCVGDCGHDLEVTVDELQIGVGIALGQLDVTTCGAFDVSDSPGVTVEELIRAVLDSLGRCRPN